jgi:hypothetical protein
MTNDIVFRLRKKFQGQLPICLEAANEIERLQKGIKLMTLGMYIMGIVVIAVILFS